MHATSTSTAVLALLIASLGCASAGTSQTTRPNDQVVSPPRSTEIDHSPRGEVPTGQELDVRLQTALSSRTAQVEDRFDAPLRPRD